MERLLPRVRRERVKPFYSIGFSVIAPNPLASSSFTGRIWSTPKSLCKLSWFLRDFGYDQDLFWRDEVDDKRLVGLRGVVKISHRLKPMVTLWSWRRNL